MKRRRQTEWTCGVYRITQQGGRWHVYAFGYLVHIEDSARDADRWARSQHITEVAR